MSDEMTAAPTNVEMLSRYKKTAFLLGSYIALMFLLRYILVIVMNITVNAIYETVSYDTIFVIEIVMSALGLQIIPSVIGALMFGYIGKQNRKLKDLYVVPKSNTRAVSNFTAVYGFSHIFNVITIIVSYILTNQADLTEKVNTVANKSMMGPAGLVAMLILLVVIAPVFEEFIFRGVILNELKPYGNGLAIFFSGIMFGIYHGNFDQCFYTAAGGIALGYIADVTGSLVPTMIIHAINNSIGGIALVLISTDSVQRYIIRGEQGEIPDSDMIWVAMYGILMVCMIILIIIGVITAIMKIIKIKRYKTPKVWGEVKNIKKVAMLIFTVPAILAIIMIIDTYGGFTTSLIEKYIGGTS